MSKYFKLVKNNFDKGYWEVSRVRDAVAKGWITAEEFQDITGEVY